MSFDVVLLFMKVSAKRATDIARERSLKGSTLDEQTMLSPSEVVKLLRFCLDATFLAYKVWFYINRLSGLQWDLQIQ